MVKISQREAEQLRERGMGNSVKMCNKTHKSRKKRYFAVESAHVLKTLEQINKASKSRMSNN